MSYHEYDYSQNSYGHAQGHERQQQGYGEPYPVQPHHQPSHPQYDYRRQAHPGQRQQYTMADQNYLQKPMAATFYPTQNDDFFMPELISPTPTRIMPEVPSNMQEGLAHLELEARSPTDQRMSTASTVSSMQSPYLDQHRSNGQANNQRASGPGFTASYGNTNASAYQNMGRGYQAYDNPDSPKFSPFPKLRNPGQNVPLSDEDKEEVLERARSLVLQSSDPEMQLAWAQDALSWVEVSSQSTVRQQQDGQSGRSITPKVEHQLREDALNIVRFLADQHHPKAEFMKGMWLEFGKFGYRVDKKEAFLSYKRSAEKGYARAEYRIGMQYENSNNSFKAVEHYQKGVAMGDSASNYRLGMMTLLGQHGTPQDYRRGVDLIRFAADTADENAPQGAYVYGMLLARELPNISIPEHILPSDLNDANMFIEKAAYLGFAKAQLKMGQAYELCQLSCEFEPALSLHYNALAARQGESEAELAISKWFLCGYEPVFEKNEELAFTYAKRAAQAKLPTAEFAMGYYYEIGVYVPVDLREAETWYLKASEHGNKDALGRIDSIKKNNTLSKKDHEQVAVSRIRSQYGSQRGGRPDRFKQKPAPMPSMNEERSSMPDPRSSYAPAASLRPLNNAPPPRPVSAAPYPEDDLAHMSAYNSRPQQGLRPSSSGGPQADRPSSAFGIRPVAHANTDNFGQNHPQSRPNDPMRPSTSIGNMHLPAAQASRGNPAPRIASTGGWEPQVPTKFANQAPTLPQIDMGRPMNLDQGINNKPLPLNVNKPQPPQPAPIPRRDPAANQYSRPERLSSRPSPAPQSMMSPPPLMSPPAMSPHYNQSIQRPDSQQQQSASRQSQRPPQQTMSSQQRPDSRVSSAAPSPAPSSATQGSNAPPKKTGPATFEEMGIPVQQKDSDCTIM